MDSFKKISVAQAQEIIQSSKTTIVDVRAPEAYQEAHIDQAQLITDENIATFLQEADKEIVLICYCYHGFSSQQAASYFVQQGFKQVYSIDGGFEEWKKLHV